MNLQLLAASKETDAAQVNALVAGNADVNCMDEAPSPLRRHRHGY